MERLSSVIALSVCALACAGCGSEATVTQTEEEMFKNPKPVDRSKIPANVFESKGPSFIGEPTGATNPSGQTPPPVAGKSGP